MLNALDDETMKAQVIGAPRSRPDLAV